MAFEKILRSQGPFFYTLARHLTANPGEARGLFCETFQKAQSGGFLSVDESACRWHLYRHCLSAWRRRQSYWRSLFRRPRPEDRWTQSDPFLDALYQLPPLERAIVLLRDSQNLSYEKIAALLDQNTETVRVFLARAREALWPTLSGLDAEIASPLWEEGALPMTNRWKRDSLNGQSRPPSHPTADIPIDALEHVDV